MKWSCLQTNCGVPLYVCEMPHVHSVSSAVLVKKGTCDEAWPSQAGLAHALEHMMFHGAGVFNNSQELSAHIEDLGGWLNAFTAKEATSYINGVPKRHFDKAVFALAQQILYPRLISEKIPTEMLNIIEELKGGYDDPEYWSSVLFNRAAYSGNDLAKDVLGTREALLSFGRDDFYNFWSRFYHGHNFVFVVVGAVKAEEARHVFDKYFSGKVFYGEVSRSRPFSGPWTTTGTTIEEREIQQANIRIGWRAYSGLSAETMVYEIFRDMISSGMSSPLFQEVREKRGLCYTVKALTKSFKEAGDFQIYIGTDVLKVDEAISVAHEVVRSSCSNENLLHKVKEMITDRLAMQTESTGSVLMAGLYDLMRGLDPKSVKEKVSEIKKISIRDVESVVNRDLAEDKMVKAMILPRG